MFDLKPVEVAERSQDSSGGLFRGNDTIHRPQEPAFTTLFSNPAPQGIFLPDSGLFSSKPVPSESFFGGS